MANQERGEIALSIGDRVYTLVTDFDARCQVESLFQTDDKPFAYEKVALFAASYSSTHLRAIFWGALRRHHPEITLVEAGELILKAGGAEALMKTIQKVQKASSVEGKSKRPQRARRQKRAAGARTTSTRDASASRQTTSGG
jgi:hypothetical protein